MKKAPFKLKSGNKPNIAKMAGVSPVKRVGSSQELTKGKKKTEEVVDSDTQEVRDVATQRLIDAGAPKEVVEKSRQKFVNKKKKQLKKQGKTLYLSITNKNKTNDILIL